MEKVIDPLNKIKAEISDLLSIKIPNLLDSAVKAAQEQYNWQLPEKDKRFALTEYFIEGSSYSCWEKHSNKSVYKTPLNIFTFEQDNYGTAPIIGTFGGARVCVSFYWSLINGYYVCFYEPTSNVVNWEMVEKWIKERSKGKLIDSINLPYHEFKSWGKWKDLEEVKKVLNKINYE